jgi:5-methylcytosine-specific restriction endonuclease McrA
MGRAEEVHHIIELTPENINDPSIALNLDNLMCLCHNCHTRETKGSTGDAGEGYVFDENGQLVPVR